MSASERPEARSVSPDGTVNVVRRGVRPQLVRDLYHVFRSITWPRLILVMALIWLLVNLAFAGLFLLQPGAIQGAAPGAFDEAFFFSVQTLSTIGYGAMSPGTTYGHLLVALEAFVGLLLTAMATGLVFAKFATPRARILFTRHPLITTFDGERVFMFRLANERSSHVVEASIRLVLLRDTVSAEGIRMRRFVDLPLERDRSPVFALGWTVFHPIDEASPLFGLDNDALAEMHAAFMVVLSGTDDALAAGVHARHAYDWRDLRYDVRYADVIETAADGGVRVIDYRRFHDIEPL